MDINEKVKNATERARKAEKLIEAATSLRNIRFVLDVYGRICINGGHSLAANIDYSVADRGSASVIADALNLAVQQAAAPFAEKFERMAQEQLSVMVEVDMGSGEAKAVKSS